MKKITKHHNSLTSAEQHLLLCEYLRLRLCHAIGFVPDSQIAHTKCENKFLRCEEVVRWSVICFIVYVGGCHITEAGKEFQDSVVVCQTPWM